MKLPESWEVDPYFESQENRLEQWSPILLCLVGVWCSVRENYSFISLSDPLLPENKYILHVTWVIVMPVWGPLSLLISAKPWLSLGQGASCVDENMDTQQPIRLSFHPALTFEISPRLASSAGAPLITDARLLHRLGFTAPQNGGLSSHLQNGGQERRLWWGVRREQGFMTFTAICIIACISCSVSTQCQHGRSVLISNCTVKIREIHADRK